MYTVVILVAVVAFYFYLLFTGRLTRLNIKFAGGTAILIYGGLLVAWALGQYADEGAMLSWSLVAAIILLATRHVGNDRKWNAPFDRVLAGSWDALCLLALFGTYVLSWWPVNNTTSLSIGVGGILAVLWFARKRVQKAGE